MKKASQFTQGDVIVINGKPKYIVLSTPTRSQDYNDPYNMFNVHVWDITVGSSLTILFNDDADNEVMSPAPLTPAQQHAGELVEMLGRALEIMNCWPDRPSGTNEQYNMIFRRDAKALLDKVRPVQPPTVEELLRALAETRERTEETDALLDRARKAGML